MGRNEFARSKDPHSSKPQKYYILRNLFCLQYKGYCYKRDAGKKPDHYFRFRGSASCNHLHSPHRRLNPGLCSLHHLHRKKKGKALVQESAVSVFIFYENPKIIELNDRVACLTFTTASYHFHGYLEARYYLVNLLLRR